jgi:hypothetical protein
MSRNFQGWPLLCALALVLTAGPGAAAEPATLQQDDLKAIRAMLDRIDGRLAAQQSQLTDAMVLVNKLIADVSAMKDEHARLKQELADLRARPGNPTSTSFYSGPPGTAAMAPPGGNSLGARVRLVNTYLTDMTAVVNGQTYTLMPGTERTITLPPGTMTYQVFMVADFPQARTLSPGEQLTLTLYPRR